MRVRRMLRVFPHCLLSFGDRTSLQHAREATLNAWASQSPSPKPQRPRVCRHRPKFAPKRPDGHRHLTACFVQFPHGHTSLRLRWPQQKDAKKRMCLQCSMPVSPTRAPRGADARRLRRCEKEGLLCVWHDPLSFSWVRPPLRCRSWRGVAWLRFWRFLT